MSNPSKSLDPAFQGAGQRVGTEIWRIENFQPVPLPNPDYGKFYSGDSYIVLQTTAGKGGAYFYDIHFWIGKNTSQDEAGTAAIKAVELDAALGGRAIQHRELQGFESDKFLSYFKPCIVPLEGGIALGFKKVEEENFESRLYTCKGKRTVRLKQVPFVRSSLNHDDVFILDTENKIYQFNGANSNIQERAKALEVIQHLKDVYHDGKCDVAIVDDGKLVAESDSGDFWVLLGGFAPIGRKAASEDDVTLLSSGKLYSITDGLSKMEEDSLSKSMLENNKFYLLDCGAEVFVWVGRVTQIEDRKAAIQAAEEFINNQSRPKSTRITRVIQGYETQSFKSNFESWPVGTGTPLSEEGRGKVAALLKQQGVDVKGGAKSAPINDEIPPLLQGEGKIEVWRINGSAKTPVPAEEICKFYSGDCYIVLYTHHSSDKKDEYFLSCWMGKDSTQDDRTMASRLANTMCKSLKGRPVQSWINQGKEPPQFIAIFQPMVVLKGGMSSGYKKFLADKNLNDETYTSENIALLQVSNTSTHNNKVLQVDAVATSLCSSDCFLLQSGSTFFTWHGNSSTFEQQEWAAKVAEYLKPGVALKLAKEGTETSAFWFALGGKQNYSSKKVAQEIVRDPHLYTFSLNKGKLKVSEVFNFSQDDLLPEDILILDTHAEVFLWVGQSVDLKEKQNVFDIGQKYIELAMALEGLSPDVPLFKVTEGNEPCFFTAYFSWDSAKAAAPGNSFTKKFSLLFGTAAHGSESSGKPNESNHSGQTQRASAWAALSSAFNPAPRQSTERSNEPNHSGPTQRASAMAALTSAFNPTSTQTESPERSNLPNHSGRTQRASAMAALTSAFNPTSKQASVSKPVHSVQGSQRAAAVAALSNVLTAESPARFSRSPSPVSGRTQSEDQSSEVGPEDAVSEKEYTEEVGSVTESSDAAPEVKPEELETDENGGACTFSYARLKANSTNPVKGIDYKRREAYLSDSEFQSVFGIPKDKFYTQPKWKQDMQKRKLDLF